MADKLFSDYLKKTLSRYFQISVLDNPELLINTAISQNPDAIIIDDNVNGISGDTLSTQIKENKMMGYIPIILLLRTFDSESYLSHLESGADRLELRTESICKLRADIRMLVRKPHGLARTDQAVSVRCHFSDDTLKSRNRNRKCRPEFYG